MRIAWYSNAPWTPSGYGVQTKLVLPELVKHDYEVHILANCGLEGGVLKWAGIPVLPRGNGPFDGAVLAYQLQNIGADVVISFYDAWCLEKKLFGTKPWVPWYPVDREPIPPQTVARVKGALWSAACSQFGRDEADTAGLGSAYIPCCVNTNEFAPMDKDEARKKIHVPADMADWFLVGIVADNKGWPSRKALPQQIEAFARFHKAHPQSALLLHSTIDNSRGGPELWPLIQSLGIEDATIPSDQNHYKSGFPSEYMVAFHNALNVLCAVSMDEGFGVPIIEAQACGTPVITGGWTAMPELVGAGWIVPREEAEPWWNPLCSYHYLPHIKGIAARLESAFIAPDLSAEARDKALEYDVKAVVKEYWLPFLEELAFRLNEVPTFEEALR